MDDGKIVELFWKRSEDAIGELTAKYGASLLRIAENILGNRSDAEECVNDTYLSCWNSIPPENPQSLSAYAGRIVRNLAISKYRQKKAARRWGGKYDRALDELESTFASPDDAVGDIISEEELVRAINEFLGRLDAETRVMFVRRYFYSDSVSDIAKRMHLTGRAVSLKLFRVREKLREHLIERGYMK